MTSPDPLPLDRQCAHAYRLDERRLLDISGRTARLAAQVSELARDLDLDCHPWEFGAALVELGARHGQG